MVESFIGFARLFRPAPTLSQAIESGQKRMRNLQGPAGAAMRRTRKTCLREDRYFQIAMELSTNATRTAGSLLQYPFAILVALVMLLSSPCITPDFTG